MSLRTTLVMASISLGCGSTAPLYTPALGPVPTGPEHSSALPDSDPLLTVTCRGDIDAGGEVCWARAGHYVVHGVRNVLVMPEEAIVRFRQLVKQTQDELGQPLDLASYVAVPEGRAPDFAASQCAIEAIRKSMPTLPIDSREAAAAANERRLCLYARWLTSAEEVVVTLVPAVTSALDGPGVPGPGFAERYGLRLYRATRDLAARTAYEKARVSGFEALEKSIKPIPIALPFE